MCVRVCVRVHARTLLGRMLLWESWTLSFRSLAEDLIMADVGRRPGSCVHSSPVKEVLCSWNFDLIKLVSILGLSKTRKNGQKRWSPKRSWW